MKNQSFKIILILFIVFCFFFYLEKKKQSKARHYYSTFCQYYQKQEYQQAQSSISKAAAICPDNALYQAHAGIVEYKLAMDSFSIKQIFDVEFEATKPQKDNLRRAIHYYNEALLLNKFDDNFYHNLAWLYYFAGDTDKTIKTINKAVNIEPLVSINHTSLGLLQEVSSQKNLDSIFSSYKNAICLSPVILDSEFFSDLQNRHPHYINTLINNVILDLAKDQHNPIVMARLAKVYLYQQNYAQADSLLQNVLLKLENLNRVWFNLGVIHKQKNEFVQAEDCFKKAHFLDPFDVYPYLELASLHNEKKEQKRAISYYGGALKMYVRQTTEHAKRIERVYINSISPNVKDGKIYNDVIPFDLLEYSKPKFDWEAICNHIAFLLVLEGREKVAAKIKKLQPQQIDELDEILMPNQK